MLATTSRPVTQPQFEVRYKDWGEQRATGGTVTTSKRYTNQVDDGIGLYFYNARYYDSALGRFVSADSIIPNQYDPQSWDRFEYARNNPINYNDPSGHSTECAVTDKYCSNGQLDTKQKALDFADNEQFKATHIGYTTYYNGLSEGDQETLQEGGWDAGAYNDHVSGSEVTPADALHDPATYIVASAVGLGMAGAITLGSAGASSVTSGASTAVTTGGIIVLGRYPNYLQVANDVGGNVFNLDPSIYNAMSPTEQWAANQSFLDEAIAGGDTFYLADPWANAGPGTNYLRELQYLFSKGFTLSLYQNYLLPPQ